MWQKSVTAIVFAVLATAGVAQTAGTEQTTGNLITNTWTGTEPYTGTGGGVGPEGSVPGYNSTTNTIYFGYIQGTASQTIAINQALSGTGIRISGYNYSWEYYNFGEARGTLTGQIRLTDPVGNALHTYNYDMPKQGNQWYTQSGTQNFGQLYGLASVGNLEVSFTGQDDRFWGGYYGPQIRNINVGLNYGVDQCVVDAQSSPACPGYRTYYNISDDGYAIVPLPFGYPFYGRTFTHSIFFDNGLVSFYDPVTESARLGGQEYFAEPLSNTISSQFHYSIMPLWSDLRNYDGSYYTQSDSTYMKYTWENISQYGYTDRKNTFSLEIRPSGYLGIQYDKINIDGYPATAGILGNASLGEWTQIYHNPASSSLVTGGITNWSRSFTQDCANPLNDPGCVGYAEAYLAQQCTINALYNTSCPGYAAAYFTYQCTVSALYSPNCPGYAQAYFDQQCTLDPLYNTQCPGYADAYYVQQCTADPLYDTGCTGYTVAYAQKYILNTGSQETVIATQPQDSNPPLVSDPVVNQAVTTTATSADPAQSATATVSLVSSSQPVAALAATDDEKKEKTKTDTAATDQPRTTRQALAERRLAAARAKAVEDGKQLAGKMGEAASMEAQVAVQGVVISAMGFTPGFDAYGRATLPDAQGYRPFEIYPGQRVIDNPAGRRFMTGSDRLHADMVDQQYGATR